MASHSIQNGLKGGVEPEIILNNFSSNLRAKRASFVTLRIDGNLRGCIGTLTPKQPLARDVIKNAFAAAFRDTRFQPLNQTEFSKLNYHISVLNPSKKLLLSDENELLEKIVPFQDGIIIKEKTCQATFLPSVWKSVSDPQQFIEQLKLKAGLDKNYWSKDLEFYRYTVEEFP